MTHSSPTTTTHSSPMSNTQQQFSDWANNFVLNVEAATSVVDDQLENFQKEKDKFLTLPNYMYEPDVDVLIDQLRLIDVSKVKLNGPELVADDDNDSSNGSSSASADSSWTSDSEFEMRVGDF